MTREHASPPVRVDIVSDVVCPWCVIGFGQFQRALAQATRPPAVDIHWQPFELNPDMPPEGENLREHLARKAGITAEQSRAARQQLTALGEDLGFSFHFTDDMRIANTFRAHQLLHWAAGHGRQTELKLALFRAYFTRGEDISDSDTLLHAAASVGLPADEARAVLEDGRYADAVRRGERQWLEREIRGVPAFVFNQRFAVLGAQEPQAFLRVFERLAA